MNDTKKPRFILPQIGSADKHNLCSTFYEAVKRFYDDPANLKRFEEWQRQQRKQPGTLYG